MENALAHTSFNLASKPRTFKPNVQMIIIPTLALFPSFQCVTT